MQVILLGDGTVGKSSICLRFTSDQFTNQYKQTIGVDFFLKRLVLPGTEHRVSIENTVVENVVSVFGDGELEMA
jgi:GTPase SAR1 family protein